MYDSTSDTIEHIGKVQDLLESVVIKLEFRSAEHDASKLEEPEKSMFDEYNKPRIKEIEKKYGYGSDEYKEVLKNMGEALLHHYEANRHHPEHFDNGVNGMTLIDVIEMLCDWKASSVQSGSPLNLEKNKERFKVSDQLFEIFKNTVKEFDW